jgi:FkbM family methyltransferase
MNLDEIFYAPLRALPFRGKYRLSNLIVPRSGLRSARIFGYSMELDLSDYMQRSVYAGLYEVDDASWLRTVLKEGMTFVDVGANIGYYTALGASVVGKRGRVFAFEPDPFAFARLERFVKLNGLSQVECRPMALSNQEQKLTLFVPPKSYRNHNPSTSRYCNDMTAQEVSAGTLDRFAETSNVGCIDLLKIDVEGHELRVLQGGQRSIREGRIKRILCEFNEKMLALAGSSACQLYEWLSREGYHDVDSAPKFGTAAENRRLVFKPS